MEILASMAQHLTNPEIADRLSLSRENGAQSGLEHFQQTPGSGSGAGDHPGAGGGVGAVGRKYVQDFPTLTLLHRE